MNTKIDLSVIFYHKGIRFFRNARKGLFPCGTFAITGAYYRPDNCAAYQDAVIPGRHAFPEACLRSHEVWRHSLWLKATQETHASDLSVSELSCLPRQGNASKDSEMRGQVRKGEIEDSFWLLGFVPSRQVFLNFHGSRKDEIFLLS